MKSLPDIGLSDVQDVYSGPEGELWELIMGEQIHIGGFVSSMDLAERAGIEAGTEGVDLCCGTGAGMRFLLRFRQVARMTGVDVTEAIVERGRERCRAERLDDRTDFDVNDACDTGLRGEMFHFVWGEDAWCYVEDKERLIAEAARLLKPGGPVAFTDWIEGEGLTGDEAERYLRFMKFPSILTVADYRELLTARGCEVSVAEDTKRFAPYIDLYLSALNMQLKYDALKILGFDRELLAKLGEEMTFMRDLAHAGKIAQGIFVARKAG